MEFYEKIVQNILEIGKSIAQIARNLGILDKTLYYWVR
ncbi:transposase [Thermoflavimicrobium daqui]|uniref:Transposase n=1 Tax=Thermoflavimicrobium daqui TaxID=2137476 RepID=A0A364K865_9BACL|nr:hypothetical protein DL897_05015 [Thermoflavimicrobium daqui]